MKVYHRVYGFEICFQITKVLSGDQVELDNGQVAGQDEIEGV